MVHEREPAPLTVTRVDSRDSKGGFYGDSEVEEDRLCAVCPRGADVRPRGSRAVWREAAAEAACSALLVLLTCLPACAQAPPLQRALAAGLVVTALVQCFDHVSGAMMNPAVTLAAVVVGHRSARRGATYLAAQAAGAAAGGALLRALAPGAPAACRTLPAPNIGAAQAACVEALLGGVLAWANCASWDARNRRLLDSWPLRVGFTVTGLTLAAGSLTGASANPLRSLAPALYAGDFTAVWVYCVGPPSGSLCAAAVYRAVWGAPAGAAARGDSPPRASSATARPAPDARA
ncbi:PREDICTED: aquaporin AQPAn.G-like [Papilio xuthus]|uniref:Aquaporin AQPAn.G-like n=1 Tax=Papilio xuthus TaxID=66420 RepID=A0AAJ7EK35_PAPXU|nr:PREDICTED: aquaporin AQPAn.G-like [Papilio xuthus]